MKSKKEAQGAFAESREVLEARGGQQQHAGQAQGIVSTLTGRLMKSSFSSHNGAGVPFHGVVGRGAKATRRSFLGLRRWAWLAGM